MIAFGLIAVATAIAATPSRVHVAGGEHAERLAAALAKEPDVIVGAATEAEAIVSLTATTSAWILVVKEADGTTALERRIDLDRGVDPALRMAVLLIRGAFEPMRATPSEEQPELAPLALIASKSATIAWLAPPVAAVEPIESPETIPEERPAADDLREESNRPFAIDVTPAFAAVDVASFDPTAALYVHVRFGPLAVGVAGMYAAAGARTTGTVEGEMRDALLMLDAAWTFSDNDPLALAGFVAGGVDFIRAETRASTPPFASEGTPNEVDETLPVFLVGLDAKIALTGPIAIDVRAGVRVLPQRIAVGLPQAFVDANPISEAVTPLKSSLITGFLSIGATFEVF